MREPDIRDPEGSRALSDDEYQVIFESVKKGKRLFEIPRDKFPGRHKNTIARAFNVAQLLHIRADRLLALMGEEAEDIAIKAQYSTSSHYVQMVFYKYKSWLQEPISNRLEERRDHLSLLKAEVQNIRDCLLNPIEHPLPDKRVLLGVGDEDWRLDPIGWFYRSIPDFSDQWRWGYSFPLLKQHMKESPFWKHYGDLWSTTLKLEDSYQHAAAKLSVKYEEFREQWAKINAEKEARRQGSLPKPSLYPNVMAEELEQFKPSYSVDYCDGVMNKLGEFIPDLMYRQLALEDGLEQLNKDLVGHEVNPIIDRGRCVKCP